MRKTDNPTAAAQPMPFEGLGQDAAMVRAAARGMRPVYGEYRRETVLPVPLPRTVPMRSGSGYQLLVAQGREIRGR